MLFLMTGNRQERLAVPRCVSPDVRIWKIWGFLDELNSSYPDGRSGYRERSLLPKRGAPMKISYFPFAVSVRKPVG